MSFWDSIGGIFDGGGGGSWGGGGDYQIPGGGVIIGGGGGGGGGIGGILTGSGKGIGGSLAQALVPLGVAAGAAALANLLQGKSGMNTQAIDQTNAQRSANYQKNFTRIPLIRRGLASLPRNYNPMVQPDPPRFIVTPGAGYPQPVQQQPMIPGAGTGYQGGYAEGGSVPPGAIHIATHEGIVRGAGSGMDDLIPARNGRQEIRLSDGEFVVPADVVSQLGDGSTEAGARRLYQMMEDVRRAKYGRPKQPESMNKLGGGMIPEPR